MLYSSFHLRGTTYKLGNNLASGIYRDHVTRVKPFTAPVGEKRGMFTLAHILARKDIKRTFGILRQRWHTIRNNDCFLVMPTHYRLNLLHVYLTILGVL